MSFKKGDIVICVNNDASLLTNAFAKFIYNKKLIILTIKNILL